MINRRNFIKTAAAGIGSVPALNTYSQDAAKSKKPLRVALIGCGVHGNGIHIPALCEEQIVALVDPDSRQVDQALKKVRERTSAADADAIRTFADYRKLFDEMGDELDAVTIATPNHLHPGLAKGHRIGAAQSIGQGTGKSLC